MFMLNGIVISMHSFELVTWKNPTGNHLDSQTTSCMKLAWFPSTAFISVIQSCPTLCDPMYHSTPGLPVHHQPLEFTQTHVHRVSDAIQPSHHLLSSSPPGPNRSQHQGLFQWVNTGLFQWVNSSHEVATALEFQLWHQFCQRTSKTDLL